MARTGIGFVMVLAALAWSLPQPGWAQTTVKYVHTDALGSVVAMTDASGLVVEAVREYEPYGGQLVPAIVDGPGYAGHVQDATTGLTYMQQRYYDPEIPRFLSVDPVTAYDNGDMRHFNRYAYAFNNPYSFKDPDGRCSQFINGLVGGLPCEHQQRNLNPAHVAADQATARDAYMVAIPMVAPVAGVAAVEAGPAAVAGTARAISGARSDTGRAVLCLLLSCKTVDPAKPREASGQIRREPTKDAVDALRRRAEQNDTASKSTREGGAQQGTGGGDRTSGFQGVFRVEGRIDSRRLDRELKGK